MPTASRAARLGAFLRSAIAGGAATLSDLVVLTFCVAVLHMSPRIASLPALLVGGVVNFYGNRHFAFRASSGALTRQATLYAITEAIALALNGVLFDAAMRAFAPTGVFVMVARLVTQNAVFVLWSYPVWRKVFAVKRATVTP
jgi:putative flippase GtrA